MFNEEDRKWLYGQFKDNGYDTGSYEDFTKSLDNDEDFEWWHNEAVGLGLEVGDLKEFGSLFRGQKPERTPEERRQDQEFFEQMVAESRPATSELPFPDSQPKPTRRALPERSRPATPSRSTEETEQAEQMERQRREAEKAERDLALQELYAQRDASSADYAFIEEYEARQGAFDKRTEGLKNMRGDARKMDLSKYGDDSKWLNENRARYKEAKKKVDEIEGRISFILTPEKKEEVQAARKENRQKMNPQDVIARGITPFGRDNTGKKNSTASEYAKYSAADEMYAMAEQQLDQGSKYDPGYDGNWMEQAWTAASQFVGGAVNNIDKGSLTMGLSEGTSLTIARRVGDRKNAIIEDTFKEMGYKDEDADKLIQSVNDSGNKLSALIDELDQEAAQISTMEATLKDAIKKGKDESWIRSYTKQYNDKIKSYNERINGEYTPLMEEYQRSSEQYDALMTAIDAAVESKLSDGDKAVLDALEKFTDAKMMRANDVSVASAAGAGAEQSAEFMLDFILTGGLAKAGTKAATKLTTRHMMRKMGKDAVLKNAFKIKPSMLSRIATDAVVAAERTAIMFPRNLAAYGENLTQMTGGKDQFGRYQFDRSHLNAAFNTALTQYIEYWSEGFGEYFAAGEQALFRSVTGAAPRVAVGKTLKGYRGSIGKYLDYGKFDGMFNEMLEEVVGSSFNALAGWMSNDRIGDQEALKEFFSGEQLATLALSFLPMSAISASTNISAYNKMKTRYNQGVEALNQFVESGAISREELEELVTDIAEKTPEEIKDKIVEISDKARKDNGGRLPDDFAQNLLGYVEGTFAMQMEGEKWEESREKMRVVDSYTQMYQEPYVGAAYDLRQEEAQARELAAAEGVEESILELDSYSVAQHAQLMSLMGEEKKGAALMEYASAKAAMSGLTDGYKAETEALYEKYESDVRGNLDMGGRVIEATIAIDGEEVPVFIVSGDAKVGGNNNVTTPSGGDGIVYYMLSEDSDVQTAKASRFANAKETATDFYLMDYYDSFTDYRKAALENALNTKSSASKSQELGSLAGHSVYVHDGNGIPVDEKTGEPVYDAQGVTPLQAYEDIYGKLKEKNADAYVLEQSEAADKALEKARELVTKGDEEKAAIDEWDKEPGEGLNAFLARQEEAKEKVDERIGKAQEELPELERKAAFWKELKDVAEENIAAREADAKRQELIAKYGVDTSTFDLTPQSAEEAVADTLGNSSGIISLDDAKKELFGKKGRVPAELFRHAGNGGILTKKGGQLIADVANDIVGEYDYMNLDQDDVRSIIIDFLARYTKTEMRDMIFNNRLDAAIAEKEAMETQEGTTEEEAQEEYGPFGQVFRQFVGKAKEAIKHLMTIKSGEAIGALSHPEIGPIDLVWGDAGTSNSDGYGLAKLVKFHPEVVEDLQDILNDMKVVKKSENRIHLESEKYQAVVRLTWDAKRKTWLLTAFEKKNSALDNTTDTGETNDGKRNDTATPQDTVSSEGKGNENSEENNTPAEKTTVQESPATLRAAYESNDSQKISVAEKAVSDFINSSDDVILLRGTENVAKERRKKAEKGSAEYKLQDFIVKAVKKRIGQLDKADVKAHDHARAVYEGRFTAEKEDLESAIAYFQGKLEAAQALLDNVQKGADKLYVANLKNSVGSAKRYVDVLSQELNRFKEETTENETTSESASTPVVKQTTDEKIEDFGEKIGGARKDTYRAKIRDSVKLSAKDLSTLKDPDKILPRKKIISLMEEGDMSKEDGLNLLSMNMAVRALSDTLGMKTLGLMKYRDLASAWEQGKTLDATITDADIDFLIDQKSDRVKALPNIRERERKSLEVLFERVYNDYRNTYEALNYPAVYRALKSAYIRVGSADGRYWVVGGPNASRGWPFATMEQAVAKMESTYPEVKVSDSKSDKSESGNEDKVGSLSVVKDEGGWYRIKSRSIPGKIYLSKRFYSKKDAEQFLNDNATALVDREQKMVDALLGSNIGMVQREGRDYRGGKDVTPEQMLETFGFRGVEFGNWVPQAERQEYLNKTYDAIMDFCDIVGISPKAFSLGGRLGLAFGARGHSRALAHYEPMKEVINLTRMKGAGSLAHEWFHALDNYLAKQKTGNISDMATSTHDTVREETAKAFKDFVSAMDKLDYSRRSNRAGEYWGEVWERAARLFESYVYNELGSKSVVSPLLVRKDTLFDDVQSEDNSASSWPYPSIAENEQMKPFFDNLFNTIEEKVQENGQIVLAGVNTDESENGAGDAVKSYTPSVPVVNSEDFQERMNDVLSKMTDVSPNSKEYKELIEQQKKILGEYIDAVDPEHIQVDFRPYDELEDYFRSIGMSETSARYNAALMQENDAYGAYFKGRIIMVNEKNTDIDKLRNQYTHERQHYINERDGIAQKLFDKIGGDLDALEKSLIPFVGTSHAANYRFNYRFNPSYLADEIIAYATALAYEDASFANNQKFSQLATEIQDFLNELIDGQFNDSYRPAIQGRSYGSNNVGEGRRGGVQTTEGESGGVSGRSRGNDEGAEGDQTPRFGLETNPEILDRLEKGEKIKVYRAMQLIDGKLYPPMSAKVDGKLREPIELGKWEKAVEQPELADDNGNFVLNKGNGSSLKAKYNPYIHTSRTPLNDQFTSAYNRPNLVTVEVEVPESELTSGYKAEKAKDAVGEMTWHSGPVSGRLPEGKKRKVILSRWDKPVRVLTDAETAQKIAELLEGENISIPYNVVTPGLRNELERLGVTISDAPSGTVTGTLRSREGDTVERRVSEAERQATNKILDTMSGELGMKINRVSRAEMPKGHKTDKGFYDPKTGEMTICMDNVTDERDAIATVLHETVAHHGLRKLFGENFGSAMVRIHAALDEKGREWVNSYIVRHDLKPGDAAIIRGMEEYMAHLAENGDFKSGVWEAIKEIFGKIVDAILGTEGFVFTNNELNYILRASYENLKNPDFMSTPAGKAWDTLLKRELGINESDPHRPIDPDGHSTGILYRDGSNGDASEEYNLTLDSWESKMITEHQDADHPVRVGMQQVMREVGKNKLEEDEDYATIHNLASSRAETEAHNFELFHFKPMLEQVRAVRDALLSGKRSNKKSRLKAYSRVIDYLYAVSGLERNAYKNAEIEKKKQAALSGVTDPAEIKRIEKRYEDMKRDWSGITSLMGVPRAEWRRAEAQAQAMIDAFKVEVGDDALLDELWNRVRSCTDFSLDHAYSHGMLTRDEYERLRGTDTQPRMWEHYLPLRGFSEHTAEDLFSYSTIVNPTSGNIVVKKADGRWTEADNPLANILNIAETEIVQGNDNLAKQALYRFTINAGENTLLSASEPWFFKDGNGKWSMAEPYPGESLEDFESRMQNEREQGRAKKGRRGLKLDNIMANRSHQNEHMIRLKVGGMDKMIWVNGDPALARAVSGFGRKQNLQMMRRASRSLSNLFTTYSINFAAKNFIRDTTYSLIAMHVREDRKYRHRYYKNWIKNFGYGRFAWPMIRMAYQWDKGTLQQKQNPTRQEQMFMDFMRDGGQTGYTIVNSVNDIKKSLERSMKAASDNRGTVRIPILGHYAKGVKTLNEGFELLTRFTAYQTSRDMGRSGQQAASDAKEISVNFNRRGAQSGDGFWGSTAAYLGATHYFYNAGVQGFENYLRLFKQSPAKATAFTAGAAMMGVLTPMVNAFLAGLFSGDGDDDEKKADWYWNLPEWVRRNNLVIGTGSWYVAVPLPVEFRAPYGIGDIAAAAFAFEKMPNRKFGGVAGELLTTASGILPFNPVEGYTSNGNLGDAALRAIVPDAGVFFVDWATNRDYTGRALWKENPFSNTVPKSQGAYASTPIGIVKACQWMAEASEKSGLNNLLGVTVDPAPGLIRDAMNNYGGGFFRAAEDVSKVVYGIFGNDPERPFRWDNIPFLSGFTGHIDEDRNNTYAKNTLYEYRDLSEDVVKRMNIVSGTSNISTSMAYDNPDALPDKAQGWMARHPLDWNLGKIYHDGVNNEYVMKVHMKGINIGQEYKSREIKRKGVNTLKKEWKALRDEWAAMPEGPEKAKADLKVQEAWHLYYNAEADLVEKLMNYEYENNRSNLSAKMFRAGKKLK